MVVDRRETALLLLGDFVVLSASLWLALALRNFDIPDFSYFEANFWPFLPMFLLSLAVFYVAGLYEKQTRPIRRVMGVRVLGAQATTVAMAAILFFILPLNIAPKTILMLYLAISVVLESAWRFRRMRRELTAEERVPAILVGAGPAVAELYEEVRENARYLIHFVACINPQEHTEADLVRLVREAIQGGVRTVVLDLSDARVAGEIPTLYEVLSQGVTLLDFAAQYEELFDRVPLDHVDPARLIDSLSRQRAIYDATKRLIDVGVALVGVVIAAPVVGAAVLALSVSGGTPFIRSARVGRGGQIIRLVKLRTMLLNDHGDPELQKRNRVTSFGRFLRKSRIDELPQLWNVLRGDLSLIGPRPELPAMVAVYEKEIPHYHLRHLIAPGLSGWAQIQDYDAPRGGADVARTRRKVSFDLFYLQHRSLGLDLVVMLKSLRALLALSGT